jgi:hypothetical protein
MLFLFMTGKNPMSERFFLFFLLEAIAKRSLTRFSYEEIAARVLWRLSSEAKAAPPHSCAGYVLLCAGRP